MCRAYGARHHFPSYPGLYALPGSQRARFSRVGVDSATFLPRPPALFKAVCCVSDLPLKFLVERFLHGDPSGW